MHHPTNTGHANSDSPGTGMGSLAEANQQGQATLPAPKNSLEFKHFLSDIEKLVKDATSLTGEDLDQAKRKLNTRIATAKEAVVASGEAIAQRARQTAEVTNGYVHAQPWKAVGAIVAVAFLLGRALSKRR